MASRDYRDLISGGVLIGIGGAIAAYTLQHYAIGSLGYIGPGMLPMLTGAGMFLLGLVIAGAALYRSPEPFDGIDLRALGAVTACGLFFAWIAPRFGMLPAVAGLVLVSALANQTVKPAASVILAAGLCALSYVIFHLGLGVALPPFQMSL